MIRLRGYQETALDRIDAHNGTRPLLAMATGTGKTLVFGEWLRHRRGRALVLAHRDELITQAVAKLSMVLDGSKRIGIVKAALDERDADIVVASVQSLHARRLASLGSFHSLVVDECHHSSADTYQRILETYDDVQTLGVTATPMRADKRSLLGTWDKIVYTYSILQGIRDGYLANLRALRITTAADFSQVKLAHGDLRQDQAGTALLDAGAPVDIAQAIKEHAVGRATIIFCPTVEVSRAVRDAIQATGRDARHVDGETPEDARRAIRAFLEAGGVVTNCGIYTEGFDCAEVACIGIARPTMSEPLYIQMVGRGTRTHPTKDHCLILDFVGATGRHELVTANVLLKGATEDERAAMLGREKVQPWARGQGWGEQLDLGLKPRPLQTHEVDLWATRPFAWVKTLTAYVLDVGGGQRLALRAAPGGIWEVYEETRDGRLKLWKGPDLGYAQGWAEDRVRADGKAKLCRRDAPWRSEPVSIAQRQMMERWHIAWASNWRKGDASDAITRAIANAGPRD